MTAATGDNMPESTTGNGGEASLPGANYFSPIYLGCACIVSNGLLAAVIAWASVKVVTTMTQPQPFLENYINTKENQKSLKASMAVALEYESMAIRTQGLQVAFGFLAGLILLAVGLLLFAIGAFQSFGLESRFQSWTVNLSSSAPGLAVLLAGAIIIGMAVGKDVRRQFTATHFQETTSADGTTEEQPPGPGEGKTIDRKPKEGC